MNLQYLFEIQAGLDAHIMEEHPELKGQDNLDWKILALQVELGECANEWRGFKKWSKDQEPKTKGDWLKSTGIENGRFIDVYENPLLEEYVDCLHFILSIGLELDVKEVSLKEVQRTDIVFMFNELFEITSNLRNFYTRIIEYDWLVTEFVKLGEMLGFTWEQIETAYLEKNKVNHERQVNGY
ncbi:dUTP diphosphatase [Ornithinibacillus bavariensis]|uniref:dUTP diphosphatase n=1 Tax=Ornithinibacillus bavariensis TaxID=545502 RepID=UPI000EEC4BC5|nr:dUTPase [Ornithinibacillus sp.]